MVGTTKQYDKFHCAKMNLQYLADFRNPLNLFSNRMITGDNDEEQIYDFFEFANDCDIKEALHEKVSTLSGDALQIEIDQALYYLHELLEKFESEQAIEFKKSFDALPT